MTQLDPAPEHFDARIEDWWRCVCGNDPGAEGLFLVDAEGVDLTPENEAQWNAMGEHYGCGRCGRFGSQLARDEQSRVPVVGTAPKPPVG